MNDKTQAGYWRNASLSLSVYGIPAPLFMLYMLFFRFPSMTTVYVVTLIIGGFRLLSVFGWTIQVLMTRIAFLARGNHISGRPWWYRRFTEGD